MRKYFFLAAIVAAVFIPGRAVYAQTPTPNPTPQGDNFLTEQDSADESPFTGAGGLPGPYEIPPPLEGSEDLTNELWEYENLVGMIAMFQTVFLLANKNYVVSAFLVMGSVLVAVVWLIDLVRRRQDNV